MGDVSFLLNGAPVTVADAPPTRTLPWATATATVRSVRATSKAVPVTVTE